jgi:ketosteroid isomerase-like protein
MTPADVVAFFDALGRGDVAAVEGRLRDDVVLDFPGRRFGGRFEGKRRVSVFLRQNQRLFRDGLRFTVAWAGVCGDRAVAQWTNEGVTREGKAYANRGATVLRLDGGLVAEISDYLDTERLSETWPP